MQFAGLHFEDAWLHSVNAAVQLRNLDASSLERAIGQDGAWAMASMARLCCLKLWTFAPKCVLFECVLKKGSAKICGRYDPIMPLMLSDPMMSFMVDDCLVRP